MNNTCPTHSAPDRLPPNCQVLTDSGYACTSVSPSAYMGSILWLPGGQNRPDTLKPRQEDDSLNPFTSPFLLASDWRVQQLQLLLQSAVGVSAWSSNGARHTHPQTDSHLAHGKTRTQGMHACTSTVALCLRRWYAVPA